MGTSKFLIGRDGVNQNGFNSLLLGKRRLRNKDGDAVPDIFDCSPRDYWRDAPIIPSQLQSMRPTAPQTLHEYQLSKLPQQQMQGGLGLTQEQVSNIEAKQKELSNISYDEYFSKYNDLPDYMKQYFTSPEELKNTPEYRQYTEQKSKYESSVNTYNAYEQAYKWYQMGLAPQQQMGEAGAYLQDFYKRESITKENMRKAKQTTTIGYQGVTYTIPQSAVPLFDKNANVGKLLEQYGTPQQQPNTRIKTPPGYWNEELFKIAEKYDKIIDKEAGIKPTWSDYEKRILREEYIGYHPDLQKQMEVERIAAVSNPTDMNEMKKMAYNFGYANPEQYGEYYVDIPRDTGRGVATPNNGIGQTKTKDYYDTQTGLYSSPSPTGSQGTLYLRPPTIEEAQALQKRQQRESEVYRIVSGITGKLTAEESGSSVWKNIAALGEITKQELEKLGTQISESAVPSFRERRIEQESLDTETEQINFMIENFQNKYQNPSSLQERSSERQTYEAELNNLNSIINEHNKKLESFNTKVKKEQEKPVANLGGVMLFPGGAEFGRSFVRGLFQSPFQASSFLTGLATNPVKEITEFGGGKELLNQIIEYPASTIGSLTGQAVGMGIIGGGIKRILKPTYTTEVIGISKLEREHATTNLIFKTERKQLGKPTKEYIGVAKGINENLGEVNNVKFSRVSTEGAYSPIKEHPITKEKTLKEPSTFGAGSLSLSRETPVEFMDLTGMEYSLEGIKGFTSADIGATASKTKGEVKGSRFAGTGGGYGAEEGTIKKIFGKNWLIEEKGMKATGTGGTYRGFIIQQIEDSELESENIIGFKGGGKKTSQEYLSKLYQNTISSATSKIMEEEKKPSITGNTIAPSSVKEQPQETLIESNYPSYVGGSSVTKGIEASQNLGVGFIEESQNNEVYFGKRIYPSSPTSLVLENNLKERNIPVTIFEQTTQQREQQPNALGLVNPILIKESQQQIQRMAQISILEQQQRQKQVQEQVANPLQPIPPMTRFGFGFDIFGKEEPIEKERAYFGYVKTGNKWIKSTPLSTFQGALDVVSRKVDYGLSRQFKILSATKEIEGKKHFVEIEANKLYNGDDYFSQNKYKFRNFQQRKGVRTKLPSGAIEKSKYAMDYETPKFKEAKQNASGVKRFFRVV